MEFYSVSRYIRHMLNRKSQNIYKILRIMPTIQLYNKEQSNSVLDTEKNKIISMTQIHLFAYRSVH